MIMSPSSSLVQDIGLSRRQHRFKSGWGRQFRSRDPLPMRKSLFRIKAGKDGLSSPAQRRDSNPVGDAIKFNCS